MATDSEKKLYFRTLGTKSARTDMRGKQPQKASDLDGIGTPEPVYQIGPDLPDDPEFLRRTYEVVDPMVAEFEKQKAERDETRRRVGAKPEEFSEAMKRPRPSPQIDPELAKLAAASGTNELPPPPAAPAPNALPTPPARASGGLTTNPMREMSPEDRVRTQFGLYKQQYIDRGLSGNRDAAGNQVSFERYINDIAAADPQSEFAKAYQSQQGVFSPTASRAQAQFARQGAERKDIWNDHMERRRIMQQMSQQGPAMLLQMSDKMAEQRQFIEKRMADGSVAPSDFMAFARLSNQMAGAYAAMERMFPGQGFKDMAAQQLLEASSMAGLASSGQENMQTNQAQVAIAGMRGQGENQTGAEIVQQEIDAGRRSPNRSMAARNMAVTDLRSSGQPITEEAVQKATGGYLQQMDLADVAEAFANPKMMPNELNPGTPLTLKIAELTRVMSEQAFINAIAPAIKHRPPEMAYAMLQKLYNQYRPRGKGLVGGLNTSMQRAYRGVVGEPAFDPVTGR